MAKFKESDILLWGAGVVAVGIGAFYLFSQKAGGFNWPSRDNENKEIAPTPAEEKPCGCGMEKSNHDFSANT